MSFNKTTILQDIMAKTNIKAIVAINPYAGEPQQTCPFGKDGSGTVQADTHNQRPYTVTVLDVQGDNCERRNIQIVVYDEGLSGELAFYSQATSATSVLPAPDSVIAAIKTYVTGLGVKSYKILYYDQDQQYALVDAYIDGATTCSLKHYRLFVSGGVIVNREII